MMEIKGKINTAVDEQSSDTLSPSGDFKPDAPIVGVPMLWKHNRSCGLLTAEA